MSASSLFRLVRRLPVVGGIARRWVDRFPEGSVTTIRTGLAAGLRWERTHRHVNGYWLGHYEPKIQATLPQLLAPGGVFWDVGAHGGFFSLIACRSVGPGGRVVSIEPDPENARRIERQFLLNGFANWEIVQAAVSDRCGEARFVAGDGNSAMARVASGSSALDTADGGSLAVETITLDSMLDRCRWPTALKMDIEGAEAAAFAGGGRLLKEARPAIVVELHGGGIAESVRGTLAAHRYRVEPLGPQDFDVPVHVLALPE